MKKLSAANILQIAPWVLTILFLPYLLLRAKFGGDFLAYLGAAEALAYGNNCYNTWFNYQNIAVTVQYSYSPFFALVLIPATLFQNQVVLFAFLLASLIMFWRIWCIIYNRLQIFLLDDKSKLLWSILLFLSVLRFLLHNFEMIQVNLMLLYISVEGLYQINRQRKIVGGSLLGLGISIKLLPVLFLPYLFYRKEIKAGVFVVFIFIASLLLPVLFLGAGFTFQLLIDWWHIINPFRPEYTYLQAEYGGVGIQSLSAFVTTYFSISSHEGLSISVMNLNNEQIKFLLFTLQLIFIMATFYFLANHPFTSSKNEIHAFYEQAYIFAITPLIFPHQQKYAFIYLMPAYAFIYGYVYFQRKANPDSIHPLFYLLLFAAFVLLTLSTDGITGKYIGGLLQYMRVVTFGTFILVILLACSKKVLVLASKR